MSLRVLQIIPTLDRGGAEKQLVLLAQGLKSHGIDVHVCCLTRGGPREAALRAAGVPVTIVGKSWKVDPAAWWRLRSEVKRLQPDIVHTWLFAANAYGRSAAKSAGVKHLVAGERCVDRWKRAHEFAIDRYLVRHTDAIVTNSTGVRDFYAKHGLPPEKFVIIPNGVEPFALGEGTSHAALCDELNLPADSLLLGGVGRLWPQKNYKDLFWSMCLLKEIRRDFHLLVFGEGPHRWRLERYRRQVQITEHVHLLGERDDVARFLPHLRCFLSASAYEGQSNAMLEAMAAGVPVIATDIPGHRDLVVPGKTGTLTPPGDRAEMAREINFLLDDESLAAQQGAAGRDRVRDHFSVEQMVTRHVELYRRLVAS